ncbi:mitochondrial coenzyme A diphosphatase NUDT8 [Lutzomyia longipalpis]|uniref:Putative peroxisomal nudix hydrolase n=1 Tax=Lutzomyia longipalpis TaxID=7200 RepID=A0A1B0CT30_LUTLO|nr:mitochondrial coenzyme A diphosphatase NUDT8 [Lutzomyia longipalpis]
MSATRAIQLCNEAILSAANRQQTLEKMAKPFFPDFASKDKRTAAVLIALCEEKDNVLSLLYTQRSGNLSRHTGQVSFPGGMRDPTDTSWEDCALRETEEEIGLDRRYVDVWGTGAPLNVPYSKVIIYPVIGSVKNFSDLKLKINPAEVEKVFTVSLEHLCSKENHRHTQFKSAGIVIPAYVNTPAKVWGITAFMTHIFLKALLPKETYNRTWPILRSFKL